MVKGIRLPDVCRSDLRGWKNWYRLDPSQVVAPIGSYMKVLKEDGDLWCWYIRPPDGQPCSLFAPTHLVVEHNDFTITVSPSIITPHNTWHGFLREGIWS